MIDFLFLFVINIALAYVVQTRTVSYSNGIIGVKKDFQSKLCYLIIVLGFILFAGLRTKYNDTKTYMEGFEYFVDTDISFNEFFDSYGGFETFQSIIKKFISTNPQAFIFFSAILTNFLYIPFILKHSKNFAESIFYFCIEDFIFSMAGIKQAIAIGIALYAISSYLNKKYFWSVVLLLFAMTFHPYVICLVAIHLLKNQTWNLQIVFIILIVVLAFMNLEVVFTVFAAIGKDYSETVLDDYTINPMRVLVESVPIIISFIYRNKINKSHSVILKLGINMQIISFIFIFMGLFVNPIYLGRMSSYFTAITAIAIPEMLHICWDDEKNGNIYKALYYVFIFAYFVLDFTKLGTYSLTYDRFAHTSIGSIFKMIGK